MDDGARVAVVNLTATRAAYVAGSPPEGFRMTCDATHPIPFMLPAVLDSHAAPILRDALLVRRGEALCLDGGEVTRLGGLSLEVLLAARRTWRADGLPFGFSAISDALRSSLASFGASDLSDSVA